MVITILEGEVTEENTQTLIENYTEALNNLETGIVNTYLAHDAKNPSIWRIITVWENKDVLEKMRNLGTPKGVLIFQAAHADPTLSIYEVREHS